MGTHIPKGFILSERITGHGPSRPLEVHEAKHDYHHEGLYVRTAVLKVHQDGVTRTWGIWTKPGLDRLPRCCVNKRSGVPEDPVPLQEFLPSKERKEVAREIKARRQVKSIKRAALPSGGGD